MRRSSRTTSSTRSSRAATPRIRTRTATGASTSTTSTSRASRTCSTGSRRPSASPTGFLKADYDPAAGTLEFNFSLDKTIGIGTGVDVAPSGAIVLDSAPDQGGPNFTLDPGSTSAFYKVTYNGHSTGDLAWNASLGTVSAAIAGITGIPAGVVVTCQNTAGSCNGGPFVYVFTDGTIGTIVPNETQYLVDRRERRHVHPLHGDERRQRHRVERLARHDPGEPRHAARRRQGDGAVCRRKRRLQRRRLPDRLQPRHGRRHGRAAGRGRQHAARELEQPQADRDGSRPAQPTSGSRS